MSSLQEMRILGIDPARRNTRAIPLSDSERKVLEPYLDNIHYSQRYSDNQYEYRHVLLPKQMLKLIPDQYLDESKKTMKLLWEDEWRSMGITQETDQLSAPGKLIGERLIVEVAMVAEWQKGHQGGVGV